MRLPIAILAAVVALTANVNAMPEGLSRSCQSQYKKYIAAPTPKAFAKGPIRGCGFAYGQDTIENSRKRAVAECKKYAGGCKVVEERKK